MIDKNEIYSDNEIINKDLNETLNLNMQTLVKNRKTVLDIVLIDLDKRHSGAWTRGTLEKELEKWEKARPYKEYCQIVIFFLKKKLSQFSAHLLD